MKRMNRFMLLWTLLGLTLTASMAVFAGGAGEEGTTTDEGVTVTLWGWRPQDEAVWQAAQKALQAQGKNIRIDYKPFVPTEYDSKVLVSLQGGAGPDIFLTRRLPGQRTQALIDNNYLVPLDELVDLANFSETTLSFIRSGGKTWGVPFANQIVGIFYNQDIFEQYGFQEPESWDELLAICKKLQAAGVTPFMIPGKAGWALAMQHAMTGVSIPGEAWIGQVLKGEVTFQDAAFVDLNQRLNDLKVYYQKDFTANSTEEMDAGFAMGQAAMVFYGIWGGTNWLKLNPEFKFGYFPVPPKSRDRQARVYVYMDGSYGLNAASKNREAALQVLRFTATPEYGRIFSKTTGEMTALKGVEMPQEKPVLPEAYRTANTMASKNIYWVGSPFQEGNPTVYNILMEGMQAMYLDQITPQELAQRIQEGVSTWYGPLKKK